MCAIVYFIRLAFWPTYRDGVYEVNLTNFIYEVNLNEAASMHYNYRSK